LPSQGGRHAPVPGSGCGRKDGYQEQGPSRAGYDPGAKHKGPDMNKDLYVATACVGIFTLGVVCMYGLALAGEPQSVWLLQTLGLMN
jgi:hypothetical protein